jgi:outer membrane protein TolC
MKGTAMRTEPLFGVGVLALAFASAGCATTSTASDFARIRTMTGAALAPAVDREAVALETGDDVRAILEEPLTVEDAVRVALLNNRELRATLREVGSARGDFVQAGLLPNPEFEFDVREPGALGLPSQIDLSAEWNLTQVLLAPRRARAARADLEAARYRAAAAVIDMGYRARAAFLAFLATRERLGLAVQTLDAFAAGRDAARALFEAGNIVELDLASQEAAYEETRAEVAELELELQGAKEAINRLLGLSGEATTWAVEGTLEALPEAPSIPDALEREAIEASLALAGTRSRLEAVARRTGIARTEGWLPDITADVHAERDQQEWEVGGGARISVPLFDRQQGTIAAREAEFDALLERYVGMAIDLRSDARMLRNHLRSAHARARQYVAVIAPARARVLEQTQLQYNAMQVGIFQLLEAQRGVLAASLRRVETLREFWTAQAAFDALLAGHVVDLAQGARGASMTTDRPTTEGH